MVKTRHIVTLEFAETLNTFDDHGPPFDHGCLQQCLFPATANFETKGLSVMGIKWLPNCISKIRTVDSVSLSLTVRMPPH